jgi:hypothetical protein
MNYVVCKITQTSIRTQRTRKNQPHYLRHTRRVPQARHTMRWLGRARVVWARRLDSPWLA